MDTVAIVPSLLPHVRPHAHNDFTSRRTCTITKTPDQHVCARGPRRLAICVPVVQVECPSHAGLRSCPPGAPPARLPLACSALCRGAASRRGALLRRASGACCPPTSPLPAVSSRRSSWSPAAGPAPAFCGEFGRGTPWRRRGGLRCRLASVAGRKPRDERCGVLQASNPLRTCCRSCSATCLAQGQRAQAAPGQAPQSRPRPPARAHARRRRRLQAPTPCPLRFPAAAGGQRLLQRPQLQARCRPQGHVGACIRGGRGAPAGCPASRHTKPPRVCTCMPPPPSAPSPLSGSTRPPPPSPPWHGLHLQLEEQISEVDASTRDFTDLQRAVKAMAQRGERESGQQCVDMSCLSSVPLAGKRASSHHVCA